MSIGDVQMARGRPYKCRYCGSTNTTWKGYRKLANGKVRLRKCRMCDRKFTSRVRIEDDD